MQVRFNPFQSSVSIHIENSHLICVPSQRTGFLFEVEHRAEMVKPITQKK